MYCIIGSDASSSTTKPTDKIFGITNIKSYVPLLLNLDRMNYDAWKESIKTHCIGYSVYGHLDGTTLKVDNPQWETVDNIVKQWIYGTLTNLSCNPFSNPMP